MTNNPEARDRTTTLVRIIAILVMVFATGFSSDWLQDVWEKILDAFRPHKEQTPPPTGNTAPPEASFEWAMAPRFGQTNHVRMQLPATAITPATIYEYTITDYAQDRKCYVHPESYKHGASCPSYPWKVTFNAMRSVGKSFKWVVEGALCDSLRNQIVSCGFPSLARYTVELTVSQGGKEAKAKEEITLKDYLVVSLGDSVGSGEGVPEFSQTTVREVEVKGIGSVPIIVPAVWADETCHRSALAGSALAAKALEEADPHSSVTFVHLACSGAKTDVGLLEPYDGIVPQSFVCQYKKHANGPNSCPNHAPPHFCVDNNCKRLRRPQIDELAQMLCPEQLGIDSSGRIKSKCKKDLARRIDLLMLSVGANDVEFGDVVKACLTFQNCHLRGTTKVTWHPAINDLARVMNRVKTTSIPALAGKYQDLADAIKEKLVVDSGAVFITEYFDPTHDERGLSCNRDGGDAKQIAISKKGYLIYASDIPDPIVDYDGLTYEEYAWAFSHLVRPLNAQVRDAARNHEWTFVGGIESEFWKKGLCSEDNWVSGLDASYNRQNDYNGTMHPNYAGHQQYKAFIVGQMMKTFPAWFPPKPRGK